MASVVMEAARVVGIGVEVSLVKVLVRVSKVRMVVDRRRVTVCRGPLGASFISVSIHKEG